MRVKGTLVEWNDDRGFGYVESVAGGIRTFCHISQFAVRARRPIMGERVTYETSRDERGRLRAVKIQLVAAPRSKKVRTPSRMSSKMSPWATVLVPITFLIFISGLAAANRLPWIAPVVYMVASAVTMIVYALDKNAAVKGRWRTKESTLHLLALAGGWPGAWIAQRLFRHKTRKGSFIVAFWLSVVFNLAALAWIVSEPDGSLGELLWKIERL